MRGNLRSDSFEKAFKAIYPGIETQFKKHGFVGHMIIGFLFKDGEIANYYHQPVSDISKFKEQQEKSLKVFDLVLVVTEGWAAPDGSVRPSKHKDTKEVVMILVMTKDIVNVSMCEVNSKLKQIKEGDLMPLSGIKGNLAPEIEERHLAS